MTAPRSRVVWRDDTGQVAGVEALSFGVLIFVTGALLVGNAWAVIDVKMATTLAAREAARAFVEAGDASHARSDAERAAHEAIQAYGRNPNLLTISGADTTESTVRCTAVTFTVSYPAPAIALPFVGGVGEGIVVHASHTELVDPFRDRIDDAGEARCDA
jgi:hypothetical protein